jgi:hypothetical protein
LANNSVAAFFADFSSIDSVLKSIPNSAANSAAGNTGKGCEPKLCAQAARFFDFWEALSFAAAFRLRFSQ